MYNKAGEQTYISHNFPLRKAVSSSGSHRSASTAGRITGTAYCDLKFTGWIVITECREVCKLDQTTFDWDIYHRQVVTDCTEP